MKITKHIADQLWNDRILLTFARQPPTDKLYGSLPIGHEFKVGNIVIEERSGLYKFPYVPSIGGMSYSGLANIGMLSYSYSALPEPIHVGRYCSISSGLVFLDSSHPIEAVTSSIVGFRPHNRLCSDITSRETVAEVGWHVHRRRAFPKIEHDVWVGRDVILSMGITLGMGCIVAAGSVVTRDVEPYSIVGGNPAQHIRYRINDANVRDALLALKWWDYHPSDVVDLGLSNPSQFIDKLSVAVAKGILRKYRPIRYVIVGDGFERFDGEYY